MRFEVAERHINQSALLQAENDRAERSGRGDRPPKAFRFSRNSTPQSCGRLAVASPNRIPALAPAESTSDRAFEDLCRRCASTAGHDNTARHGRFVISLKERLLGTRY